MSIVRSSDGRQPLSALEQRVIGMLADTLAPEAAETLRAQLAAAIAIHRTHSGVGFMTRILVEPEAPALEAGLLKELHPLRAAHPQLREPAEFVLQFREGRMTTLEAYCFEGMWPADESGFRPGGH
ncbi:MAG: hypothetical protein JJT85_03600 [Chromatiales bacterium]|nr:hypothetical protein [Chromatiales bacterium]